ncbi:DUF3800 domain-containing protein [Methylobacterium tarhaniae]|uniref:DUF3800 domain-containing protein n=1 Tax=Methylobacterium tarhaniae TaxID=1187852 RepID=UPI0009FA9EC6|nr:DUF3800 domain-containing protein [Methylobacterium tarhaniae]
MVDASEDSYKYVSFIDEAGDDNLRSIRPKDPNGGTEWFVLSSVIMRADNEQNVARWVRNILSEIGANRSKDLHFNRLSADQRLKACQLVARLPIRCFVVISHKENMRNHKNSRASRIPGRNIFYCWIIRLLLERATAYCASRNEREDSPNAKMKIEFSEMHRMSYSQLRAYLLWIRPQSTSGTLYLKKGDLDWSVVDTDLIEAHPHNTRAGLMLADVVASAFYQAVAARQDGTCRPEYAQALQNVVAAHYGRVADFGIKTMPPLWKIDLTRAQKELFHFYGMHTERDWR